MGAVKLIPSIASYSGETASRARRLLTDDVLEAIARVALAPRDATQLDPGMLAELVELHVLRNDGGTVKLQTAVFLEEDIIRVVEAVGSFSRELAQRVAGEGHEFAQAPPPVTNFLGGIIAFQQGLSQAAAKRRGGAEWKSYTGRYARTKVDFDEDCHALATLGPDLQLKTVRRGERYTTVLIGPRCSSSRPPDPDLLATQAGAGDSHAETPVVTGEVVQRYADAMNGITGAASSHYEQALPSLHRLLASTTSGRQGVAQENMMMHLWRYIRKLSARELYAEGFLTDDVPQTGLLTVVYENGIELLKSRL